MDIYLRKIRNIIKNFANFALVGIMIASILGNLVGKKTMDVKDIITKTLIAGILIQASWFLMWAAIDLSTIAVSAVGSFPSSFLSSDTTLNNHITTSLTATPTRYVVDEDWLSPINNDVTNRSDNLESILPTYNSISWPLVYLWFSVFKFQNYTRGDDAGTLTISFLLRTVLILFYTIGLALLFIANVIRVVFLRLFIVGSPIIILASVFKKKLWEGSGWIMKYLNLETMLDLILKPIVFVAWFWLILIFVVSIQSIMQWTLPKELNGGVNISVNASWALLNVEDISSIQVNEGNSILWSSNASGDAIAIGQTIFVNLIIFFLTIFLMWQFIKISVTSGKWPIADVMKPITQFIEDYAKTLPILPLGWGTSWTALSTSRQQQSKKLAEGFGFDIPSWRSGTREWNQFVYNETKFNQFIAGKFWMQAPRSLEDYKYLEKIATKDRNISSFFSQSQTLSQTRSGWLNIGSNSTWLATFKKTTQIPWQTTFRWSLPDNADDAAVAAFFNARSSTPGKTNAAIVFELLWWADNVLPWSRTSTPTNYNELKAITFWKKT